jgi:glucose/arabinose dehydrogenase
MLLCAAGALAVLAAWEAAPAPASGAPVADAYSVRAMIPDGYLGADGSAAIEFAMIPGRPNEAIVAQQSGYIWRVALDGTFAPQLWGDIHDKLTYDGEQGLLSVAFSPAFVADGRVYVYYTPGSPTPTVLARYHATATDLDESSGEALLNIEEYAPNHNGGHIVFDNEGRLYLGLGDGGGSGDPNENGQSLTTLLGKVLRLDVSGASGYAIPSDNPFNDGAGPIREEIFAYGFRNPFRMTIDKVTDQLWVGDVGQSSWEEADLVVKGGNYGWDCYEGNHSYEPAGCGDISLYKFPRVEYDHSNGQAITGGGIYRGTELPELYGWYVYADFYSGHIWAVNPGDTSAAVHLAQAPMNIVSFTVMPDGEMAIVTYDNGVYLLSAADADGDGVAAISDNCPNWANANQAMPAWLPRNDDPDCDGVATNGEELAGTAPLAQCATTATANDEPPPDAWPVDFDDNQRVNVLDVSQFSSRFNSGQMYAARYDFNGDGYINVLDVSRFSSFFGKGCTP